MSIPVVAIIGRANVGKSTLFNALVRKRDALVADFSGLTRDRIYGLTPPSQDYGVFRLIDTGGLEDSTLKEGSLEEAMRKQTQKAIEEADILLWVLDARGGLLPADHLLAKWMRREKKPVVIALNKTDGLSLEWIMGDFYALGFSSIIPIAAAHRRGLHSLMEALSLHNKPGVEELEVLRSEALPEITADPSLADTEQAPLEADPIQEEPIKIAIVGKPNVGKSTLVNRILGDERMIVFDAPGTTRDSVRVSFERLGQHYILIDTAGLRRRRQVQETIEKFSVLKTLEAIDQCHVALVVMDARQPVTDQDLAVIHAVLEAGKGLLLLFNKWDGLGFTQKAAIKQDIEQRFSFVRFAPIAFISALHGSGVGSLFGPIQTVYQSTRVPMSTGRLTRLLAQAVVKHAPPLVQGRRIKLRYAHAGGHNPPIIVIHGHQTESLPQSYKRYLEQFFRQALDLKGTPVRLVFKTTINPYHST